MKTLEVKYKTTKDKYSRIRCNHRLIDEESCCKDFDGNYSNIMFCGDDKPVYSLGFSSWGETEWVEINYCPWCGARFKYIQTEVIEIQYEKVEEVQTICKPVKIGEKRLK